MKLQKKHLNKLFIVTWKDAKGEVSCTLSDFLREGWMINKTVGWLKYFDKEKVIIATETSELNDILDLSWLPRGWITSMEEIEE